MSAQSYARDPKRRGDNSAQSILLLPIHPGIYLPGTPPPYTPPPGTPLTDVIHADTPPGYTDDAGQSPGLKASLLAWVGEDSAQSCLPLYEERTITLRRVMQSFLGRMDKDRIDSG